MEPVWLRKLQHEWTEELSVGMEAKPAEDKCGWTGVGRPQCLCKGHGFPSKTPMSMLAQASATGVGRSKGLEGKANS